MAWEWRGSEPIDTLDEFYQAVFADEETRKQETIGEKESGRSWEQERGKREMRIGGKDRPSAYLFSYNSSF